MPAPCDMQRIVDALEKEVKELRTRNYLLKEWYEEARHEADLLRERFQDAVAILTSGAARPPVPNRAGQDDGS